ncbi:hypothetical protein G6052_08795 [Stenotrophomonas maltophilia]|nr:hypothetical protein G6052_08795 [Stenotrophomonas maltophilia]
MAGGDLNAGARMICGNSPQDVPEEEMSAVVPAAGRQPGNLSGVIRLPASGRHYRLAAIAVLGSNPFACDKGIRPHPAVGEGA